MKEQIIPESQIKKVLSQDHLKNFFFFFQITMWYDKYFKNTTMTKYLTGQIPEVFLQISQTH